MTTFPSFLNNVRAVLAVPHAVGSGSLVLQSGQGSRFGAIYPVRVTVITSATYGSTEETLTVFEVSGRVTDTLASATAVEGTADQAFAAGDIVEMRWTAGEASLMADAINALEASSSLSVPVSVANGGTGRTALDPGALLAGNGTDALAAVAAGAEGRVLIGQGSVPPAFRVVSGDGTMDSSGHLAVLKTGGLSFAASATTDTTDAANIAFGTLDPARLPLMDGDSGSGGAAGAVPAPTAGSAAAGKYLKADGTWSVPAGGGGSPGGSSGQVQYNSSGSFAGAASWTIGASGQLNAAALSAPGSPANGDLWYDSAQKCLARQQGGLTVYTGGLVYQQTAVVTISSTGATTCVSTTGALGTVSLPAGFLNAAGKSLRIRLNAYLATAASTPGNLTISAKLGSNVIATSTAFALSTSQSATNNSTLAIDLAIVCKTTGSSGKLDSLGAIVARGTGASAVVQSITNGTTAGTQSTSQVTLDLTAAYALDLQANFANSGNTLTVATLTVEVLG